MSSYYEIFFPIAIILLLMAILTLAWILYSQRRKLLEELRMQQHQQNHQEKMLRLALEAQESERKRISKDLHDGVGMMLQALNTTTQAVAKNADAKDKAEMQEMINELTTTIRHISWDLMPATLERFGLTTALEELARRMGIKANMDVTFSPGQQTSEIDLNQQLLIYRIAQEAVSNALRHARATKVEIKLIWTQLHLILNVIDNGIGFNFSSSDNRWKNFGLGITNMENRSMLLRGELHFLKNEPKGTIVQLKIPVHA